MPHMKFKIVHTDDPICPHCGHVDTNWWDHSSSGDEAWDVECGECGKPYRVVCHRITLFTTSKQEKP